MLLLALTDLTDAAAVAGRTLARARAARTRIVPDLTGSVAHLTVTGARHRNHLCSAVNKLRSYCWYPGRTRSSTDGSPYCRTPDIRERRHCRARRSALQSRTFRRMPHSDTRSAPRKPPHAVISASKLLSRDWSSSPRSGRVKLGLLSFRHQNRQPAPSSARPGPGPFFISGHCSEPIRSRPGSLLTGFA